MGNKSDPRAMSRNRHEGKVSYMTPSADGETVVFETTPDRRERLETKGLVSGKPDESRGRKLQFVDELTFSVKKIL